MNLNEFIFRVKPFAGKEKVRKVKKPWGEEIIWAHKRGCYTSKILVVNAGEELSMQYHTKKNETMLILEGQISLAYGFFKNDMKTILSEVILSSGNVIDIPINTIHKIKAITTAYIMEVSTFDDGDIVRLQDKYNRE